MYIYGIRYHTCHERTYISHLKTDCNGHRQYQLNKYNGVHYLPTKNKCLE